MSKRFLMLFIPTCAIAVGGAWLGVQQSGFWWWAGWIASVVFGIAAILQVHLLLTGLAQIKHWQHNAQQKLLELERRDAELFAKGKSPNEIASQYRKPDC